MQLIRLFAVAVACALGVVGYVQERRRLDVIQRLPGEKARDYYEAARTRNDRVMWALAITLALAAAVAVVRLWFVVRAGTAA
ncbi:MAG: hypothetical protein ABUS79_05510 [Pseudomonadota bacterium]